MKSILSISVSLTWTCLPIISICGVIRSVKLICIINYINQKRGSGCKVKVSLLIYLASFFLSWPTRSSLFRVLVYCMARNKCSSSLFIVARHSRMNLRQSRPWPSSDSKVLHVFPKRSDTGKSYKIFFSLNYRSYMRKNKE